jgi:hypothetical protein
MTIWPCPQGVVLSVHRPRSSWKIALPGSVCSDSRQMAATTAAYRILLCVGQRSIRAAWRASGPAIILRAPRCVVRGSLKQVTNLTSSAFGSTGALRRANYLSYRDIPALKSTRALRHANSVWSTRRSTKREIVSLRRRASSSSTLCLDAGATAPFTSDSKTEHEMSSKLEREFLTYQRRGTTFRIHHYWIIVLPFVSLITLVRAVRGAQTGEMWKQIV